MTAHAAPPVTPQVQGGFKAAPPFIPKGFTPAPFVFPSKGVICAAPCLPVKK